MNRLFLFLIGALQIALAFSCQQKPKPKLAKRPQPFAVDSLCVRSAPIPLLKNSLGEYRTTCCNYLLSDSVSQDFFRRQRDTSWAGFRVLNLRPLETKKEYLTYSVIDGRSHYDQLQVEFYYFWPSGLSIGKAELIEPYTFILHFSGYTDNLRIPKDSAKNNFNLIRYRLQVPEEDAGSKPYKILFDCGGGHRCTIYQPLLPDQSGTYN